MSYARKQEYINRQKRNFQQRILTGKTQKLTAEQKEEKRLEFNSIRNDKERDLMGGFELIFPLPETLENYDKIKMYQSFLNSA